ncbi:MAG: hypothetical protein KatS3mg101_0837 [Patescibacteria group bacterium]|nr:MAG: hypothetical protein KatS3mg101_0837 [Patescibacteria group bacterium]
MFQTQLTTLAIAITVTVFLIFYYRFELFSGSNNISIIETECKGESCTDVNSKKKIGYICREKHGCVLGNQRFMKDKIEIVSCLPRCQRTVWKTSPFSECKFDDVCVRPYELGRMTREMFCVKKDLVGNNGCIFDTYHEGCFPANGVYYCQEGVKITVETDCIPDLPECGEWVGDCDTNFSPYNIRSELYSLVDHTRVTENFQVGYYFVDMECSGKACSTKGITTDISEAIRDKTLYNDNGKVKCIEYGLYIRDDIKFFIIKIDSGYLTFDLPTENLTNKGTGHCDSIVFVEGLYGIFSRGRIGVLLADKDTIVWKNLNVEDMLNNKTNISIVDNGDSTFALKSNGTVLRLNNVQLNSCVFEEVKNVKLVDINNVEFDFELNKQSISDYIEYRTTRWNPFSCVRYSYPPRLGYEKPDISISEINGHKIVI